MEVAEIIKEWKLVGTFEQRGDDGKRIGIRYDENFDAKIKNVLYVWVLSEGKDKNSAVYVGWTSQFLKTRMNQHITGFKGPEHGGSRSGLYKRQYLEQWLDLGKVDVYCQESELEGEEAVLRKLANLEGNKLLLNKLS
jgi:hypothetical protein